MNTRKVANSIFRCSLFHLMGIELVCAQEFTSQPSGREILTVQNGFNYLGVRLHPKPLLSSEVVTVTSGSATVEVEDGVADALVSGTIYHFEIDNGDAVGAVLEITAFDATANTVTLSDDVSADFAAGDSFTIRPASTLASLFGANNEAGLDTGFGGVAGADQIWLPDGSGGYHRYYYDQFNFATYQPAWSDVSTGAVIDPSTVAIYYPDGLTVLGSGAVNTFKVSGVLKTTPTRFPLTLSLNHFGTVYPTGSTLATLFGANNEGGLDAGFAGSGGADQVWIPDGVGGFDKYYYDQFSSVTFQPEWSDVDTNAVVDPHSVSFDAKSGFVIQNDGPIEGLVGSSPMFYSGL